MRLKNLFKFIFLLSVLIHSDNRIYLHIELSFGVKFKCDFWKCDIMLDVLQ